VRKSNWMANLYLLLIPICYFGAIISVRPSVIQLPVIITSRSIIYYSVAWALIWINLDGVRAVCTKPLSKVAFYFVATAGAFVVLGGFYPLLAILLFLAMAVGCLALMVMTWRGTAAPERRTVLTKRLVTFAGLFTAFPTLFTVGLYLKY